MNNIIRKYKEKDINLQSSRKHVRTLEIIYCIIIVFLVLPNIFSRIVLGIVICIVVLMCFSLYTVDWSVKSDNNILFVRKWIFKYKIPFKDLIDIKEDWFFNKDFRKDEFFTIEYKKRKRIKSLKMYYLVDNRIFKCEYAKKDDVIEIINTFFKSGELIENKENSNPLLSEYKNIRSEEEEKELDILVSKRKNNEEKVIWLGIWIFVIIFAIFLLFIILVANGVILND